MVYLAVFFVGYYACLIISSWVEHQKPLHQKRKSKEQRHRGDRMSSWNVFAHMDAPKPGTGWMTRRRMDADETHVTPISDSMEHVEAAFCSCSPKLISLENGNGTTFLRVVHIAQDGREQWQPDES